MSCHHAGCMSYARRRHRIVAAAFALAVVLSLAACGTQPSRQAAPRPLVPADPLARVPRAARVAVLVLENRAYEQVIGSPDAPYLNRLARSGALETRYYALTHPSLPNYIALTTGSTQGVPGNCSRCDSDRASLLNQLNAAGISWRSYFESLPQDKDLGPSPILRYNKHYNPFVYTESLANRIDQSRLRGFGALRYDLAHHHLPRFMWIAPNVRHDGHNHPLRAADRAVARLVPKVVRALGPRGVLYLTWDESVDRDVRGVHGTRGGGRVALIAAGGLARHHARDRTPATHVALLRTLEANFGLPALPGAKGPGAPLLTGLLRRPGR
jgi:hypothetical protein